jgi:hypothetical protein
MAMRRRGSSQSPGESPPCDVTGLSDGPGRGLGDGGKRLHYWVLGGRWSYEEEARGEAMGADEKVLNKATARVGAIVGRRNTYEATEAWAGRNRVPR